MNIQCKHCRRTLPETAFAFTGQWRRHVCMQCRRGTSGTSGTTPRATPAQRDAVRAARRAEDTARREVEALRKELAARDAIRPPPPRRLAPPAKTHPSGATVGIVLSDWHVGELVTQAESAGLNTYAPGIARERAEATFRNAVRLVRGWSRDSDLHTLWVGLLGDFISGHIHEENVLRNVLTPVEEATFAIELLTSGLLLLAKEYPGQIIVDACVGNHGRLTKKMYSSPVSTSLESFIYHEVARALEKSAPGRIAFDVAPAAGVYRELAGGFVLRARHGHEVRYSGGVGGVAVPLAKAVAGWDRARRADLTVIGHLHGLEVSHAGRFLVNGSLIGYNAFAESIRATPEPPRQAAFLVHDVHGLSVTAPVWATEPKS